MIKSLSRKLGAAWDPERAPAIRGAVRYLNVVASSMARAGQSTSVASRCTSAAMIIAGFWLRETGGTRAWAASR